MSENVSNDLIYPVLQKLQSAMADLKFDLHDIKLRMSTVEDYLGSMIVSMSGLNHRMDRFDERLTRVERRLDLSDAR